MAKLAMEVQMVLKAEVETRSQCLGKDSRAPLRTWLCSLQKCSAGQAATKVADSRESVAENRNSVEVLLTENLARQLRITSVCEPKLSSCSEQAMIPVSTLSWIGCRGPDAPAEGCVQAAGVQGLHTAASGILSVCGCWPAPLVRARGKHGTLQKPSGGSLWTAAEEHMLAAKIAEGAHVTAKLVRAVFKQANMPLRCTDGQLHAWVSGLEKICLNFRRSPKRGSRRQRCTLQLVHSLVTLRSGAPSLCTNSSCCPILCSGGSRLCNLDVPGHVEPCRSCPKQGREVGHRRQAKNCC